MWDNAFHQNKPQVPGINQIDIIKIEYMAPGMTWSLFTTTQNNQFMINLAMSNAKKQYGTLVRAVNTNGVVLQIQ